MSALYIMRYVGIGTGSSGFGAIYVGRNTIVGVDVGNGRYTGGYTEMNGRIRGQLTLTLPNGGTLVTGQQVAPGTSIPMAFDWPANFTSGPQSIAVQGRNVQATFEKVGDVP